jgi:Dna[CI] antecedent, DciA
MHEGFISLREAFEQEPALSKLRNSIKDFDVITNFYEIFQDLEKIVVPVKVKNSTLFLRVENSVWRSELKFKEQIIIEKINTFVKEERIKKIKFVS